VQLVEASGFPFANMAGEPQAELAHSHICHVREGAELILASEAAPAMPCRPLRSSRRPVGGLCPRLTPHTPCPAAAKSLVPESHEQYMGTYWGQISDPCVSEVVESADAQVFVGPFFNDYASVGYTLGVSGELAAHATGGPCG
jgi:hypothetical protein